jgi:hypothetical protein
VLLAPPPPEEWPPVPDVVALVLLVEDALVAAVVDAAGAAVVDDATLDGLKSTGFNTVRFWLPDEIRLINMARSSSREMLELTRLSTDFSFTRDMSRHGWPTKSRRCFPGWTMVGFSPAAGPEAAPGSL